jgi:hypothetical protein
MKARGIKRAKRPTYEALNAAHTVLLGERAELEEKLSLASADPDRAQRLTQQIERIHSVAKYLDMMLMDAMSADLKQHKRCAYCGQRFVADSRTVPRDEHRMHEACAMERDKARSEYAKLVEADR